MIGAAPTPPRPTQFELDEQRKRDEERERIRAAAETRLQEEAQQRQAARDAQRLRRETMTEEEYYAERVTSRLPGTREEQLRMIGTMRPGQFQALHSQARLESDSFSAAETALGRIVIGTYNNFSDLLSNAAEFYIKGILGTPGLLDDTTVEEAVAFGNGFDRIAARLREGRRVQNERLGDLFQTSCVVKESPASKVRTCPSTTHWFLLKILATLRLTCQHGSTPFRFGVMQK